MILFGFRKRRIENDKHIPEFVFVTITASCLELVCAGDFLIAGLATPRHSYVIELKHSKADASDAEIAKKHEEALEQLKKYSEDPNLAALAVGTPVHFLCYEFKGRELVRLEEVEMKK